MFSGAYGIILSWRKSGVLGNKRLRRRMIQINFITLLGRWSRSFKETRSNFFTRSNSKIGNSIVTLLMANFTSCHVSKKKRDCLFFQASWRGLKDIPHYKVS